MKLLLLLSTSPLLQTADRWLTDHKLVVNTCDVTDAQCTSKRERLSEAAAYVSSMRPYYFTATEEGAFNGSFFTCSPVAGGYPQLSSTIANHCASHTCARCVCSEQCAGLLCALMNPSLWVTSSLFAFSFSPSPLTGRLQLTINSFDMPVYVWSLSVSQCVCVCAPSFFFFAVFSERAFC